MANDLKELKEMARSLFREMDCRKTILDNIPQSRQAWASVLTNCNFDIPGCGPAQQQASSGSGSGPCKGVSPDIAAALAATGVEFGDVAELFLDSRVGQALRLNKLTRAVQSLAGLACNPQCAPACAPAPCPPAPCPPAACCPSWGHDGCCPPQRDCDKPGPCQSGVIRVSKPIDYQSPGANVVAVGADVASGPFTKLADDTNLLIMVSGAATASNTGPIGVGVYIDDNTGYVADVNRVASVNGAQNPLVSHGIVAKRIEKGQHTLRLKLKSNTIVNTTDFFDVTIFEYR